MTELTPEKVAEELEKINWWHYYPEDRTVGVDGLCTADQLRALLYVLEHGDPRPPRCEVCRYRHHPGVDHRTKGEA